MNHDGLYDATAVCTTPKVTPLCGRSLASSRTCIWSRPVSARAGLFTNRADVSIVFILHASLVTLFRPTGYNAARSVTEKNSRIRLIDGPLRQEKSPCFG